MHLQCLTLGRLNHLLAECSDELIRCLIPIERQYPRITRIVLKHPVLTALSQQERLHGDGRQIWHDDIEFLWDGLERDSDSLGELKLAMTPLRGLRQRFLCSKLLTVVAARIFVSVSSYLQVDAADYAGRHVILSLGDQSTGVVFIKSR